MGKIFSSMLPEHEEFIGKQHMFFVGSAPLQADGHVNLSPKGYNSLRIFSPTEVAYLDLTGSGNETSAHLMENGRITLMFTSFEGLPLILRLYGTGSVILPGSSKWDEFIKHFDLFPGARQIIHVAIHKVQTSCGFGVPYYTYNGDRPTLHKWAITKGEQGVQDYQKEKNSQSLDGIATPLGLQFSELDESNSTD